MKTQGNLFIILLIISFNCISTISSSQTYAVGHKQITFTDPSRSNRAIQTEIYYPATTAGDNTPFVSGQFPLLVFGHGFVMAWSSYQWLWDSIVPHGYIMAFPRTEGNISPNHSEFGLDLAFLNGFIKTENSNSSSFFYQHVLNTSAIMGHSMGGGASFLAAANNSNLTTLINFAAAVTNPSSVDAAPDVTVPLLMFAGENDGVASPADHQIPMYNACGSSCKTKVTILGGGHCYFADYNFNCSFGEGTTSPQPTITRDQQHDYTFYILKPYLDFMLKSDVQAEIDFLDRLSNNQNITFVRNCSTNNIFADYRNSIQVNFANPANDIMDIEITNVTFPCEILITDLSGRKVQGYKSFERTNIIDLSSLEPSSYIISVINQNVQYHKLFIKE